MNGKAIARRKVMIAQKRRHRILLALLAMLQTFTFLLLPQPPTQILHFRQTGDTFIAIFNVASDQSWIDLLRMRKSCFLALHEWLVIHTMLGQSTRCDSVSTHDMLFIFMYMVCQGTTVRHTASIFGRSLDSIHRLVEVIGFVDDVNLGTVVSSMRSSMICLL